MDSYLPALKENGWALSPEGTEPILAFPTKVEAVEHAGEHLEK